MKKRLLAILLVLFLLPALAAEAFAFDSTTVELPDLDMSIEIPEDYFILTQDIEADDPALDYFGFTQDYVVSYLQGSSIYLDALDAPINSEILVIMTPNDIADMNDLPDDTLEEVFDWMRDSYADMGLSMDTKDYYTNGAVKYMVLDFHNTEDTTDYAIQYYTLWDYKAINLVFHSYDGPVSAEERQLFRAVVDSVRFDSAAEPESTPVPEPEPTPVPEPENTAAPEPAATQAPASSSSASAGSSSTSSPSSFSGKTSASSSTSAKKSPGVLLTILIVVLVFAAAVGIVIWRGKRPDKKAKTAAPANTGAAAPRSDLPICPVCGRPTHPGRFCERCGADLAPPAPQAPSVEEQTPVSALPRCPACGKEITRPDSKFCEHCGSRLEP